MTKREKRLQKMRQNVRNVKYNDFIKVLDDYGFEIIQAKGSHMKAVYTLNEKTWTVVFARPHSSRKTIHEAAVKAALNAIDEIEENTELEEVEEDTDE